MRGKLPPFGLSLRAIIAGARRRRLFFGGTLWALNAFFPGNPMDDSRPALTALHRCSR